MCLAGYTTGTYLIETGIYRNRPTTGSFFTQSKVPLLIGSKNDFASFVGYSIQSYSVPSGQEQTEYEHCSYVGPHYFSAISTVPLTVFVSTSISFVQSVKIF